MDKFKKRHLTRQIASQIVYISFMDDLMSPWKEILIPLLETQELNMSSLDLDFLTELMNSLQESLSVYQERFDSLMKNGILSLPAIERAILLVSAGEMHLQPSLTKKAVIINEALTLIRDLSEEKNVKFLNAVLDKYALKYAPELIK